MLGKEKSLYSIIVLTSLLLASCSKQESQRQETPRPIMWVKTESSDMSQIRRLTGVLQASESADLSFEVGGKVQIVNANLGDLVSNGDILAKLDISNFELNKRSAIGNLQEARAVLVEAENEFRRQSNLFEDGYASEAAVESAKASLDTAKSSVDIATAQLNLTEENLKDTALLAPYNGRIVARFIEPSQTIPAGQTAFQIEGEDGLEVSVLVPETIIGNLRQGESYRTYFPVLPGVSLVAQITEIGTRAGTANAFPVTLLLKESQKELRAGMSAEVDLIFTEQSANGQNIQIIRIPPTAVLPGPFQKSFAFVYDESSGSLQMREIQIANVVENDILISSGLEPGEIIAVAGVEYLYQGQSVRLMGVGTEQFN